MANERRGILHPRRRTFRSPRSSINNQTCFLLGAIKKSLEACELLGLGSSQARSKPDSPRDKAEPELRDGARVSRPYVSGTQVRFKAMFGLWPHFAKPNVRYQPHVWLAIIRGKTRCLVGD